MNIYSYSQQGFDGEIVAVNAERSKGIPSLEINGVADAVVGETAARIVSAVKNSGFSLTGDGRISITLNPVALRKDGPEHELSIALSAIGAYALPDNLNVMALGELELSGKVRAVNGVLPAVIAGKNAGIDLFLVPKENYEEACLVGAGNVFPVESINSAVTRLALFSSQKKMTPPAPVFSPQISPEETYGDFADMFNMFFKHQLIVAAAGRHNVLIAGTPGSGKTMAAQRFVTILPDLDHDKAIETARIHSLAGIFQCDLVKRPPMRMPHHTASLEGMVGGGRRLRPGEMSLAHNGILLLDDAMEFSSAVLAALRIPLESHRLDLIRAGKNYWYPSDFQLVLTAASCPCGCRGGKNSVCVCSDIERKKYWARISQPVWDRIDMRIAMQAPSPEDFPYGPQKSLSSAEMRQTVEKVRKVQEGRFEGTDIKYNSQIPISRINKYVQLDDEGKSLFYRSVVQDNLSPREAASVLRVARTIADVDNHYDVQIKPGHVHTILLQNKLFGNQAFDFTKNVPVSRSTKSLTLNEISICQEDAKKMSKEQLAEKLFNLTFNCNGETSEFRKEKLEIYFSEFLERIEDKAKASDKKKSRGRGR